MMTLAEISKVLNVTTTSTPDAVVTGVSIDSRKIKKGELFVAIQGENFDGHDFIDQAKQNGAIAAIVARGKSDRRSPNFPILEVKDTRIALGELAAYHRQKFNLPIIALTGSCGKTTVKEMLRAILSQCGVTLANQGSLNNDLGVPLTLLQLNAQHKFAVIEMGANHHGEIAYLTQLVKPNVAFINNVASAHLEGFGSLEGVAKAKSEIFQGLSQDGKVLINNDDSFAEWISQHIANRPQIKFGIKSSNNAVTARDIKSDELGCFSFILKTSQGEIIIRLPVFGQHNVLNAVAAATAAQMVGASLAAIKAGLESMQPVKGRLVMRAGIAGARIFDDTYNANPYSMSAALKVLMQYPGEKIFVMGDMVELGEGTENHHRDIGVLAKELGVQQLFACGKLSKFAVDGFGRGAQHFNSQQELSAALRPLLNSEITVLVKGSRSSKMENVVAELIKEGC